MNAHKSDIKALDRTLCDIRLSETLIGCIRLVFAENLKQKLLLVLRKARFNQINVDLESSKICSKVK